MTTAWFCLVLCVAQANTPAATGSISGTAVNGSRGHIPLADVPIVLRASLEAGFEPVAETRTDAAGRFSFTDLPIADGLIYLPGVNHQDIHYPGSRLQLTPDRPAGRVQIIAYDAVGSPDPLVCRRAEFDVRPGDGYLEVAEKLVIANLGNTSYIGEPQEGHPAVTLRLELPGGFDKVTFDEEFLGRNFVLHNHDLVSSLPWPPGERTIKFRYRLPVAGRSTSFARRLDLTTQTMALRIWNKPADEVACSLVSEPAQHDGAVVFEYTGETLPAGRLVELSIGALPLTLDAAGRWGALLFLGLLIAGALIVTRRRGLDRAKIAPAPGATPRNLRQRFVPMSTESATRQNMPQRRQSRRRRRAA
ncbi:MAG: hypothetical protein U0992_21805 [Planctomycetaceae bacterium]